jgi:hypothetical protein
MTALLFLAVDSETPIVDDKQPLLNPELRCVSAAYITLGAAKDEFFKSKRFILMSNDDASDLSSALQLWHATAPPSFIFAFDAPFVLRRIAAYCISEKTRFLPAYYWCGTKSRTFDICYYLTGENNTTAIELLKASNIDVPSYYTPHADSSEDLKYLLSLADKYGIIKADLEEEITEIPITDETRTIKMAPRKKTVTKKQPNE